MARRIIIGIDEVGRGPLAGPVTVAAVACPHDKLRTINSKLFRGIKDSKKLSAIQREAWFLKLKKTPYAIASVSSAVIDTIGIAPAIRLAVGRCIKKLTKDYKLSTINSQVLLDGALRAPSIYKNQKTIIKGDEKNPVIAAASIVAKVHRDRLMVRIHKKYPHYGFDAHKGYGTKMHQAAIRTYGLCAIHRKSFCKKFT